MKTKNKRNNHSTETNYDWIRNKLKKAENSGFTNDTKSQILAQSKASINYK